VEFSSLLVESSRYLLRNSFVSISGTSRLFQERLDANFMTLIYCAKSFVPKDRKKRSVLYFEHAHCCSKFIVRHKASDSFGVHSKGKRIFKRIAFQSSSGILDSFDSSALCIR
jgi:hypothetical protein